MRFDTTDLEAANRAGLLGPEQTARLAAFLEERQRGRPGFRMAHLLQYLGGLIAIGALTLFMNLGWERFGGWGLLAIAAAYAAASVVAAGALERRGHALAAGLLAALAVAVVPLGIYGLQVGLGWLTPGHESAYRAFHRYVDWRWLFMELGTLAAGAATLYRFRLPVLTLPVAVTGWYLGMDLAPFLFGPEPAAAPWSAQLELRGLVAIWMGIALAGIALWLDLRGGRRPDFGFWLYLFGVLSFWGGLMMQHADSEWDRLGFLAINLALLGLGILLVRRVLAVFGGLGVALYLGHLAHDLFADSLLFPFALTAAGLLIVWLGLLWQRHEQDLIQGMQRRLPAGPRRRLEAMRRA
ncbi:MAG TPA: DUF2157 domain-containing protein [Gammaproteobacteria bacterium]|nr:DUF2157 domain-containing protein [Gammaproteobacteria bacterium]